MRNVYALLLPLFAGTIRAVERSNLKKPWAGARKLSYDRLYRIRLLEANCLACKILVNCCVPEIAAQRGLTLQGKAKTGDCVAHCNLHADKI
jgi:hypothetical protein